MKKIALNVTNLHKIIFVKLIFEVSKRVWSFEFFFLNFLTCSYFYVNIFKIFLLILYYKLIIFLNIFK